MPDISDLPPILFAGLVDDAAVFPPGNASLPDAVARHALHRTSSYAGLVGPLLVPVDALGVLGALVPAGAPVAGEAPPTRLRVGAVARPGTALDVVMNGLAAVDASLVEIVGLEVPALLGRRALLDGPVPLTVEVRRGTDQVDDLDALVADRAAGHRVQAKFRTGPTPTWPWPDEAELADFIRAAVDRSLPFKLTGGLHHAIRGSYAPVPGATVEEQHGLLNVLLAVHRARGGDHPGALGSLLAERDSRTIVAAVQALTADDAATLRAAFTAYGCCLVTDPITELADLGLLEDLPT